MKVTARAKRVGKWWAVEIPEVRGAFTQVRRLDQVEEMARDAVAMLKEIPAESIEVAVTPQLDDEIDQALAEARSKRARAETLERQASAEISELAKKLTGQGMTLREVGIALGVSYQRVAQLTG